MKELNNSKKEQLLMFIYDTIEDTLEHITSDLGYEAVSAFHEDAEYKVPKKKVELIQRLGTAGYRTKQLLFGNQLVKMWNG